jgi:hypothetical protein
MILPEQNQTPLLDALADLQALVRENAFQPLHQIAEGAVMHWLRIAEGKDQVQPRFSPDAPARATFLDGFEPDPANQLDDAPSAMEWGSFDAQFPARRAALIERLRVFFERKGYRPSADQCDQVMVELERLSRFLTAWLARVVAHGPTPKLAPVPPPRFPNPEEYLGYAAPEEPGARIRWHHLLYEPYLNEAIVTWEENTLNNFDQALEQLLGLLEMPEHACAPYFMRPGHPLRPHGRRRMKVAVFDPVLRPLRNKSVFTVRFNQLARKVEDMNESGLLEQDALVEDVHYLIAMIRENMYQIASEPGFLTVSRPGVPTIRGRPSVHPFLLDTAEFFKKAILFDNGTYTVSGGGMDTMLLEVRQLERYFRFESGPLARRTLAAIDACTIAWEQNQRAQFTGGLIKIAECLRGAGA